MAKRLSANHIRLERAYEPAAPGDGVRILVDRLWPRQHSAQLEQLRALAREAPITLVDSAHDEAHNDAVVLRRQLLGEGSGG